MRIVLLLLAALIVAAGAGYYVLLGLEEPAPAVAEAPVEAPKPREVFFPARALSVGTIIVPEHLGRLALADAAITPEMVVADAAGEAVLLGSVARQVLPEGVPIARSAVVQPGERGFLAAVLPRGKRAISIPIGEVAGVSGLALPGDRVDIILTYSVAGAVIDAERDIRASETVMTNLRVLALDQRLQSAGASAGQGAPEPVPIARTATLEVTPRQAEMITLATTLGDLSLVLNSVRDGGEAELDAGDIGPLTLARASLAGARAFEAFPRALTLDSDVTSLLQRQLRAAAERAATPAIATPAALPLADRRARVQVVRGIESLDLEFGAALAAPTVTTGPAASEPAASEPVGQEERIVEVAQ